MTCRLVKKNIIPERARFPVVDAHNHLWSDWDRVDEVVRIMDAAGVLCCSDLTANLDLHWVEGGYSFQPGRIETFFERVAARHPGRFYCFTTATFSRPFDAPLFSDARAFVEETIEQLREHVRLGARGMKILKELGLRYRDSTGKIVFADDPRLAPIWDEAGQLGVPVLIHQSDPVAFFEPITPENEHYDTLKKFPSWSFADPAFPRKKTLLEHRDQLVKNHPRTNFILAHVANHPENLAYVSSLLDSCPNAFIDFSARTDELGRQPYTARDFFLRHSDRILFGTDMPITADIYRYHFRFLETRDEYFIPPDYDGTFGRHRWKVYGLGLPDEVLRRVYHENAIRLIPGLLTELGERIKQGEIS